MFLCNFQLFLIQSYLWDSHTPRIHIPYVVHIRTIHTSFARTPYIERSNWNHSDGRRCPYNRQCGMRSDDLWRDSEIETEIQLIRSYLFVCSAFVTIAVTRGRSFISSRWLTLISPTPSTSLPSNNRRRSDTANLQSHPSRRHTRGRVRVDSSECNWEMEGDTIGWTRSITTVLTWW